jgi:hypothetical protein
MVKNNEKAQIMNLINHLNPNLSAIKKIHNDDPLHYIEEEKIIIKFINRDKVLYNVQIPVSINKNDLYSIAQNYKSFYLTKILLIHNNSILDRDESSINIIANGDTIIIVEDRYYQDNSYYNSLQENNNIEHMINVRLLEETRQLCGFPIINLYFPPYITFSQMMKAIYFKFDRDDRDLSLGDYSYVNLNDKIQEIFGNRTIVDIVVYIHGVLLGGVLNIYGKQIYLHFPKFTINTGVLNSNKKLIKDIERQESKIVKKININGKELNIGKEKSLLSFGIKEDCQNCKVEFE